MTGVRSESGWVRSTTSARPDARPSSRSASRLMAPPGRWAGAAVSLGRLLREPGGEGVPPGRALGRAPEVERERPLVAAAAQLTEDAPEVDDPLAGQEVLLVAAVG